MILKRLYLILQREDALMTDDQIKNTMRLLMANSSYADYQRNRMYLMSWEKTERQIFHNLELALDQVKESSNVVNREKSRLEELRVSLKEERYALADQKTAKENLIEATHGKQSEYLELWKKSQEEMYQSQKAIEQLQSSMAAINEKLQILEAKKRNEFGNFSGSNSNNTSINKSIQSTNR